MGLKFPYFSSLVHLGVGVFSYGLHVCGGFLVHCIQACSFACSLLPIALDSSLVPTVSGRVRGLLAGGSQDGQLLEVVGFIPDDGY